MNKRKSGILMHVSSLDGGFRIGSFGEAARRFVDKIAEAGFSFWQVLPMSMTDEYGSPYKSAASFGANPYFIDIPSLYEEGLLTAEEVMRERGEDSTRVDFSALRESRMDLLRLAASRVVDRSEIVDYVDARPELSRAAYFLALSEANGGSPWQEWKCFVCDIDELYFWQFIQYKFYTQWFALKDYANARGIEIIGDLPIYVDINSADVWAEPEEFLLDEKGYPIEVSGVPPDYFSAEGQLWGNPLYNLKRMKKDGFGWWRRRLSHALTMYDGVRIDHFRAIEAYWSIPVDAVSAREGAWKPGGGKAFIRMLLEVAGDKLVIAEDLGDITDEVRALVDYSGLPGMRVAEFGFLGDENSIHLPHNIPSRAVAYTGTHDNDTLLGFLSSLDDARRADVLAYFGITPSDSSERDNALAVDAIIRALMVSPAELVVLPIQDILSLGTEHRMNTPGVASGNWTFRISSEEMSEFPTEKLRLMNRRYGRNRDL